MISYLRYLWDRLTWHWYVAGYPLWDNYEKESSAGEPIWDSSKSTPLADIIKLKDEMKTRKLVKFDCIMKNQWLEYPITNKSAEQFIQEQINMSRKGFYFFSVEQTPVGPVAMFFRNVIKYEEPKDTEEPKPWKEIF